MFTIKKTEYRQHLSIVPFERYKIYIIIGCYFAWLLYGMTDKAPSDFLVMDGSDIAMMRVYDYLFPSLYTLILSFIIHPFNLPGVLPNLIFLSKGKTVRPLYYVFVLFTMASLAVNFISCLFFFSGLETFPIVLVNAFLFLPNVIFLGGLFLVLNSVFKNTLQVDILMAVFILVDYFSQASIFKLLSIGVTTFFDSNNTQAMQNLLYNRLVLVIVGMIFAWIGTQAKFIAFFNNRRS